MFTSNFLGVISALISASIWGCGDFMGGFSARRQSQYQVLVISAISGLLVLIAAAFFWRESFPSLGGIAWAMAAGVSGALGMACLYRGLSIGRAASIAPTAAVIGATLPVLLNGFVQGMPGPIKLLGFGLAFTSIWLVAENGSREEDFTQQGFLLACLSGVGFGGFFFFLGQVEHGKIFTPLIITRCMTLATGLVLVYKNRLALPGITSNPPAILTGVLDAGGNLFYVIAKQYTRLDVAVVLSSLYPAATVLLAALILKEKVSFKQGLGVAVCLAAIGLITV